ncbi:MAG: hypothetical protein IMW91_09400 [Firmicutes bacterium]|nr:hypothetical protein [Bacillota bacterium]
MRKFWILPVALLGIGGAFLAGSLFTGNGSAAQPTPAVQATPASENTAAPYRYGPAMMGGSVNSSAWQNMFQACGNFMQAYWGTPSETPGK